MQCLPTLGKVGRQEGTPSPSSCMQGTDCGNVARAIKTVSLSEETLEIKKQTGLGGGYMYLYVARWEAGEGGMLGYVNGWSGVSVSSCFFWWWLVCVCNKVRHVIEEEEVCYLIYLRGRQVILFFLVSRGCCIL